MMDALIDAVFSEGFFWAMVVIIVLVGPTTGKLLWAHIDRKRAAQKQRFELEKRKLAIEQAKTDATKPICLCEHGSNVHDPLGACTARIQQPVKWNDAGVAVDYETVECPCLDYTGPRPGVTGSILGELGER